MSAVLFDIALKMVVSKIANNPNGTIYRLLQETAYVDDVAMIAS